MNEESSPSQVLAGLWNEWGRVCKSLAPDEWQLQTRCGDWNVKDLVAHVSTGVGGLEALVNERTVQEQATLRTAAEIIRAVKPDEDVAAKLASRVSSMARDDARDNSIAELIERFERGDQVCESASVVLDLSADYFGRGIATIRASIDLRIVEAVVHLMDLQEAVNRPVEIAPRGMEITRDFLVELIPVQDFVEAATGRRSADFFPVHS